MFNNLQSADLIFLAIAKFITGQKRRYFKSNEFFSGR